MTIYQGTYYTRTFAVTDADDNPIDITGWEFESDFRDRRDTTELLNLTTGNGGWTVVDGPNGRMSIAITAAQTAALPTAVLVFDVLRTDPADGPLWLFQAKVRCKQPITRT